MLSRRQFAVALAAPLGLNWFFLNDLSEAERYLETAIRLDPAHFSHPRLALGEIYQRRGDRHAAIAPLRQFLDLHPDAPDALACARLSRKSAGKPTKQALRQTPQ